MEHSERVNLLKEKMLKAVQADLTARSFDIPGSDSDMVAACGELLMFFSIGGSDHRTNLTQSEMSWWSDFCDALKQGGKVRDEVTGDLKSAAEKY